ncbi:MAG: hypothetical protein EXR71_13780 [Myxococcales bacterium]|nr:hypothetical protein [Myxococcales bacterium]
MARWCHHSRLASPARRTSTVPSALRSTARYTTLTAFCKNTRYLAGIEFPPTVVITDDMEATERDAEVCIEAVPSTAIRTVMAQAAPLRPPRTVVICATKGIEPDTRYTMDQILAHLRAPRHWSCSAVRRSRGKWGWGCRRR